MDIKRKATITDVARAAGVSTATAGRVLGGYGYSSPDKKDRVLKAAEDLGYRPNQLARSLITGKTLTIGFVAGDIQSPFYAKILRGVSDVVGRAGFGLLITNSDEKADEELRSIRLLQEKQVDGIIVSPCDAQGSDHLRRLAESLPVVLIDRAIEGLEIDRVGVDNVGASRDCVLELIAKGHTQIGLVGELFSGSWGSLEEFVLAFDRGEISDVSSLYPSWQRFVGYLLAHREANIAFDLAMVARVNSYSIDDGAREVNALLKRKVRPTSLFTVDGLMTEAAMAALSQTNLSIPDDISLIGFDDLDWMGFVRPGIDAVAQPRRKMGEVAARMLLERIEGKKCAFRNEKLATRRVRRGSVQELRP